jgi:hypothetical protein
MRKPGTKQEKEINLDALSKRPTGASPNENLKRLKDMYEPKWETTDTLASRPIIDPYIEDPLDAERSARAQKGSSTPLPERAVESLLQQATNFGAVEADVFKVLINARDLIDYQRPRYWAFLRNAVEHIAKNYYKLLHPRRRRQAITCRRRNWTLQSSSRR